VTGIECDVVPLPHLDGPATVTRVGAVTIYFTRKKEHFMIYKSVNLSAMLDQLRDAIDNGDAVIGVPKKKAKAKTKKNNVKQVDDGEKPEPTRGPHVRSIKVNGSGEMISRFELNKRLAEHAIEPGTDLHSPKYGKIRVTFESDESPYLVIDESGNAV